jgi:putative DNA primase/helicase
VTDLRQVIADVWSDGRQRDTRCPAHDDRKASLSVGLGDDGRVLLNCHGHCTFEAVLAAAGLTRADVSADSSSKNSRTIVAEYAYRDERGTHLYDIVRFVPKDFRMRRADGAWTMKGVRRVLYRLPELQGRRRVYITEGEKDADRLWSVGIPATTNPGGAGKWRDEFAQQLAAANVEEAVILADNDDAGRGHADQVATKCRGAHLAVKVVNLPHLPKKGDISDWFDAGHTVEELTALVATIPFDVASSDAADVPTGAEGPRPIFEFLTVRELAEKVAAAGPRRWLVRGIFPGGDYGIHAAEMKAQKTWNGVDLAVSVASETPWLGHVPVDDPGPVLIFVGEGGEGPERSDSGGPPRSRSNSTVYAPDSGCHRMCDSLVGCENAASGCWRHAGDGGFGERKRRVNTREIWLRGSQPTLSAALAAGGLSQRRTLSKSGRTTAPACHFERDPND